MSNITNNRVSVTLSADLRDEAYAHINSLEAIFPLLLSATVDEWTSLPKIDVDNKQFVEDAIAVLRNRANELPPQMQPMVKEMEKDLAYFKLLDEVEIVFTQFLEKIRDTRMLAGSEAFQAALAMKKIVSAYAAMGLPGWDDANDRLGEFFKKMKKNTGASAMPETTDANE